jgi:hypothetical protein
MRLLLEDLTLLSFWALLSFMYSRAPCHAQQQQQQQMMHHTHDVMQQQHKPLLVM